MSSNYTGLEIAIIGMSGRFPGSKNIKELWENLCAGKELITHFTKEELLQAGVSKEHLDDPNYVRAKGIIEDVDKFDAELFGFYPKEVEMLDPQQRLFLECSWEAMEDAGYTPDNYEGLAGVFGGIGMNTYVLQFLNSNNFISSAEGYQLSIGNDKDFLTTRVSYKLNLKGPSLDIQTACSTSLVATHIACMNLINFQCDLAIAGGITVSLPQKTGYHYQEGMILSPDGHCKPFDANAGGTVAGNGVGIVVLKRLEDAIADKDSIYAVIKGSAYNNDGSVKVGYTAPGVNGQTEVITSAYAMADVPMESIGYIETHGTGTSIGDPIEIEALTQAFKQETDKKKYCAIGSVKSNLGHLDTAAGITGLIKAALSIYYGEIPPSINFTSPNPKINFEESPFYVNTKLNKWKTNGNKRRAGVSSFGIGGTNVHVVLEEAPLRNKSEQKNIWHLFPFSAKTNDALNIYMGKFKEHIKDDDAIGISDVAYTLQTGRKHFEKRQFIIADSKTNLLSGITEGKNNKIIKSLYNPIENPSVVFMFSGQGSQYVNMCKELYETENTFRKYADECFDILNKEQDVGLKEIIYPNHLDINAASEKLKQTEYTQPALFIIEYSLAMMLIDLGIYPHSMIGHSIGEFVAACIAGVMDLESALKLVSKRGSLMQKLEKGSMLSVTLSERELKEILPANLDIAVVNAPDLCVISGEREKINKFEQLLNERQISNAFLNTSHAFHSSMMEPVLDEFKSVVEKIHLNPPSIPYLSNVTGDFITDMDAVDPNYYVNHLRYTVRFSENISKVLEDKKAVLVEIGPGSTLASLAKLNSRAKGRTVINSVKHPKQKASDNEMLLTTIGYLWLSGLNINWNKFYSEKPYRVHLPTYSFTKNSYWLETKSSTAGVPVNNSRNWYYYSSWKRKRIENKLTAHIESKHTVLVFDNNERMFSKLLLQNANIARVVSVIPGSTFNAVNENIIEINPSSRNDYLQLFDELIRNDIQPGHIVHAWSSMYPQSSELSFDQYQNYGFFSLINLANAIFVKDIVRSVQINVVTSNIFDVTGYEKLNPNKSTILGACKIIHQEFDNLKVRTIDIDIADSSSLENLKTTLVNELLNEEMEVAIALRGNHKWVQIFEPLTLGKSDSKNLIIDKGVYVITGGLGRIGLLLAEHLSKNYKAKIYLLDHSDLPEKDKWNEFLKSNNRNDKLNYRIKHLQMLNDINADVTTIKVDVADYEQLKNVVNKIVNKTGKINGVFHAAGSLGDDMIRLVYQVDEVSFAKQVKTKIKATENLALVIDNLNVDFILLQSSLSAVLGGLGFASYSAGNCYIDAFVQAKIKNNQNNTKWISVNWDGWSFTESNNGNEVTAITPTKGMKLFEEILTDGTPGQVIVSTDDIYARIKKWIIEKNTALDKQNQENIKLHDRPNIDTEYLEPETDLEKQILTEWIKLLGIEKIGINDNFFDLGGNSLIGTQLVSRMRKVFNLDIPIQAIFENATIKGIAGLIKKEKHNDTAKDAEKLSNVLDLLDKISDEEAAKLLDEKKNKIN